MARLILEFNQEVLRDFPVRSHSITIGRQKDNTIALDNPRVSSYHARIDKRGPDYILTDLQSTNGTFVNNEPVVSHKLLHGDRIMVGEHVLLFVGTEKAKVEAEREKIPLNQTVIIGAKRKPKEMAPRQEIERQEFRDRGVKASRPYRRITPIFLAVFILIAGGWLLLSYGPFLMRMIFERTAPSQTTGDASQFGDREPVTRQGDGSDVVSQETLERPVSSSEVENPGRSSPQEESSSFATSEESEPAATEGGEIRETSEHAASEGDYVERFKLDGVVWSSDEKQSFAVINGIILRVGGSIEEAVVTDIGRNYVVLKSREDDSEVKLFIR